MHITPEQTENILSVAEPNVIMVSCIVEIT